MSNPAVSAVLTLVLRREPLPGGGRLLCIDGPAGSGKTTLAAAVRLTHDAYDGTATVLHMDDFYDGWGGLDPDPGPRIRAGVTAPFSAGEPGAYRRFDWGSNAFAEEHIVPPVDLLILEGVGAGSLAIAPHRTALVWIQAPEEVRIPRGLERDRTMHAKRDLQWDDAAQRAHWERFVADEKAFFTRHGLPGTADLRLDGTRPLPL